MSNPPSQTPQQKQQAAGSSPVGGQVGIGERQRKNPSDLKRFTKKDWLYGPKDDWGWGYVWGYRRAQYHYAQRCEKTCLGANKYYKFKDKKSLNVKSDPSSTRPPGTSPTIKRHSDQPINPVAKTSMQPSRIQHKVP